MAIQRALTAAALLFTVAPSGIAVALDLSVLAVDGALLVLFVLGGARWLGGWF